MIRVNPTVVVVRTHPDFAEDDREGQSEVDVLHGEIFGESVCRREREGGMRIIY